MLVHPYPGQVFEPMFSVVLPRGVSNAVSSYGVPGNVFSEHAEHGHSIAGHRVVSGAGVLVNVFNGYSEC